MNIYKTFIPWSSKSYIKVSVKFGSSLPGMQHQEGMLANHITQGSHKIKPVAPKKELFLL